ncbi:hypothetical protein IV203_007375 [Nitzschia inconspicua]|uniref:Uncharacterized protein n=1 Tax=Nitzschia inconspicua TaxID=303405 RepID=A0A9K3PCC4_9STRA|nr:hypothetical protein IV203_007375 [Nitzschia inconspicua]
MAKTPRTIIFRDAIPISFPPLRAVCLEIGTLPDIDPPSRSNSDITSSHEAKGSKTNPSFLSPRIPPSRKAFSPQTRLNFDAPLNSPIWRSPQTTSSVIVYYSARIASSASKDNNFRVDEWKDRQKLKPIVVKNSDGTATVAKATYKMRKG